jgi:hypothetical protein
MAAKNTGSSASVKDSILNVLKTISADPSRRKLLSPDFSLALNAVGETFVDLLLQWERKGKWWLADDGKWHECSIKSLGQRVPRNFLPGPSTEWGWYPTTDTVRYIADRMTGPDHVVAATIESLNHTATVVLEQKLRFGTNQDAIANASTYLKHLLEGLKDNQDKKFTLPKSASAVDDAFVDRLVKATQAVLLNESHIGVLSHSGSVPHVCFVSIQTPPHKVFVCNKNYEDTIVCDSVGFLAPIVNQSSFSDDSVARRIVHRAEVRLWLGLDSLLNQCETEEVERAWSSAIDGLSASVRNPKWLTRHEHQQRRPSSSRSARRREGKVRREPSSRAR